MPDRLRMRGETNSPFRRVPLGYSLSMVLGTVYNAENIGRWSQEP